MALLIISAFGLQIAQKQTFAHVWYYKVPENLKKFRFISLASRGLQILINIIVEKIKFFDCLSGVLHLKSKL